MTTLSVKIDKEARQKYNLTEKEITFDVLKERIIRAEGLSALRKATRVAQRVGLKRMSTKEIEKEIKATRNGKGRS
jgi:hypothetical protein